MDHIFEQRRQNEHTRLLSRTNEGGILTRDTINNVTYEAVVFYNFNFLVEALHLHEELPITACTIVILS